MTPPPLLQIVRETIRPGGEPKYGEVEETLAKLCAERGCPNFYLALASIDLPREVWWLTQYSSQADVERVRQGYSANPGLVEAMTALAQGKKGLTSEPIDTMTEYRPDLSNASPWAVGEQPFAVILESREARHYAGATFHAPDGRYCVFASAATQAEAVRIASQWGAGARAFATRPEWSLLP